MDHDRKILQNERFVRMSCWDIAHSSACKGLWTVNTEAGNTVFRDSFADDLDLVPNTVVNAVGYCMKRSHPIYKKLAKEYGVTERRARRRTSRSLQTGARTQWSASR